VTYKVLPLFPAGFSPTEENTQHCGKLQVLCEMLGHLFTHTREKIVVVSNYTQTLDLLERVCSGRGYKCVRLDGSTPSSKRFQLVEHLNSQHSPQMVFLLSSKAGGVGLNLVGASRLILYDIDWNPANDLQAMARVWRDGQRRKVHIYRLLTTGSIEEKIYQRQISKSGLAEVMEAGAGSAQTTVKFSSEELKDTVLLQASSKITFIFQSETKFNADKGNDPCSELLAVFYYTCIIYITTSLYSKFVFCLKEEKTMLMLFNE
jgi:DNA repair and recombination protein RAD54B